MILLDSTGVTFHTEIIFRLNIFKIPNFSFTKTGIHDPITFMRPTPKIMNHHKRIYSPAGQHAISTAGVTTHSNIWQIKKVKDFSPKMYRRSCLCAHHEHIWGSKGIAPLIHKLGIRCKWMVSFMPWLLCSWGDSTEHTNMKLGGPRCQSWRERFLALQESNHASLIIQPVT